MEPFCTQSRPIGGNEGGFVPFLGGMSMRRFIVLVALLGLSLFLFPSVFAQEKSAEADPKLVAKALSNPYIQGKVVGVDKETKVITVQVVVEIGRASCRERVYVLV